MNAGPFPNQCLVRRIRRWTALFIVGLVLSGATALPLETELGWLAQSFGVDTAAAPIGDGSLTDWVQRVAQALRVTNQKFPFMAYGTDWLAFAHFVIAVAFVGAWRDPVRNRWLFDFGLIACVMVIPFALIAGAARGIPLYWRLIDCLFGVGGAIPLWICRRLALEAERKLDARPASPEIHT
jgi:hypothetical protein